MGPFWRLPSFPSPRNTVIYYLQISHSLSVLGWYVPGLSELPLGNRLLLLAGPCQRFSVCSISLGTFSPFFFFRFVSVRVVRARHRGRARHRRGCHRVVAGRGGVARSAVAVSWIGVKCASRHEGSMNGLCLASWCGSGYTDIGDHS